jgi:hypothetical protein
MFESAERGLLRSMSWLRFPGWFQPHWQAGSARMSL